MRWEHHDGEGEQDRELGQADHGWLLRYGQGTLEQPRTVGCLCDYETRRNHLKLSVDEPLYRLPNARWLDMFLTEEVTLVEFYQSGLRFARDAGYKMVFCLVARHADATGAYDEIIQKWESLDDLTGSAILFLFAGDAIRRNYDSKNFVSQQHEGQPIIFNENALMLNSQYNVESRRRGTQDFYAHYSVEALRSGTRKYRSSLNSLGRHQPERPNSTALPLNQSREVSELRNYLGIREADIPCLHVTFLSDDSSVHFPVLEGESIYRVVKALVAKIVDSDLGEIHRRRVEIENAILPLSKKRAEILGELKACFADPVVIMMGVRRAMEQSGLSIEQREMLQSLFSSLDAMISDPSQSHRSQAFSEIARIKASECFQPLMKRQIISVAQRLIDKAATRSLKASAQATDPSLLEAELVRISESIELLRRERKELAARQDLETPTAVRDEISSLYHKAREIERCEPPEVFISYSRRDAELATDVHKLLEARGLKVFRDTDIRAPELFRPIIRRKLDAARAVVVLWTSSSVNSEFVTYEADRGRQKLVQLVEPGLALSDVPAPFTERQTIPVPRYDLMLDSLRNLGLSIS